MIKFNYQCIKTFHGNEFDLRTRLDQLFFRTFDIPAPAAKAFSYDGFRLNLKKYVNLTSIPLEKENLILDSKIGYCFSYWYCCKYFYLFSRHFMHK